MAAFKYSIVAGGGYGVGPNPKIVTQGFGGGGGATDIIVVGVVSIASIFVPGMIAGELPDFVQAARVFQPSTEAGFIYTEDTVQEALDSGLFSGEVFKPGLIAYTLLTPGLEAGQILRPDHALQLIDSALEAGKIPGGLEAGMVVAKFAGHVR